jgi:hypothetical protein
MDEGRESLLTPAMSRNTVERKSEREFVDTHTFNSPARPVFEKPDERLVGVGANLRWA